MELAKISVLVAENDTLLAESIADGLTEYGYDLAAIVKTGELAIIQAAHGSPDIVLMDVHLDGEMDGIEAAKQIHSHHKIPVIFLTALPKQEVLGLAKESKHFAYIGKPFRWAQLLLMIDRLVNVRRENK